MILEVLAKCNDSMILKENCLAKDCQNCLTFLSCSGQLGWDSLTGWGLSAPGISDGQRCSVQVLEAERLPLLMGCVPFGCPVPQDRHCNGQKYSLHSLRNVPSPAKISSYPVVIKRKILKYLQKIEKRKLINKMISQVLSSLSFSLFIVSPLPTPYEHLF